MTTYEQRTVSISIDRDWREVYDFAHQPENFPRWASGLASGVRPSGEEWVAQGPAGEARIRFSPPNDFGVLDHLVIPPNSAEIPVPMRIIANGTGCEVMLTLFRTPGMSPETFAADADWVRRDLQALRDLVDR